MPLRVNIDTPDGKTWTSYFPFEGGTTPALYVIRADGKQMYGRSGTPPNLPRFLHDQLQDAGEIPSNRQLALMARASDAASRLYLDNNIGDAITKVKPFAEVNSYALPAVQLKALAEQFEARGEKSINEAANAMQAENPTLEDALALVRTRRTFGKLPSVQASLNDTLTKVRDSTAKLELLEQAELIDAGIQLQRRSINTRAVQTFRELLKKHPHSEAAALATEHLKELESSSLSDMPDAAHLNVQRAKSLLVLARSFDEPELVRRYAGHALELVPADSALATEARRLIQEADNR